MDTINKNTILDIYDDASKFLAFIKKYYELVTLQAHLRPTISDARLYQTYESWRHDMSHISENSMSPTSGKPDHFKYSGVLSFWLRRNTPITCLVDATQENPSIYNTKKRKNIKNFLSDYHNEYLAFDIGFKLCGFYNETKKGELPEDYVNMICYFLRYKNVSPHAMIAIYRALYI